jgi:hypothetical protein
LAGLFKKAFLTLFFAHGVARALLFLIPQTTHRANVSPFESTLHKRLSTNQPLSSPLLHYYFLDHQEVTTYWQKKKAIMSHNNNNDTCEDAKKPMAGLSVDNKLIVAEETETTQGSVGGNRVMVVQSDDPDQENIGRDFFCAMQAKEKRIILNVTVALLGDEATTAQKRALQVVNLHGDHYDESQLQCPEVLANSHFWSKKETKNECNDGTSSCCKTGSDFFADNETDWTPRAQLLAGCSFLHAPIVVQRKRYA